MLAGQERVRLVPAWPDMLNTLNIDNCRYAQYNHLECTLDIYSWLTWGPLRAWRGGLTWWPGTGRAPGPAPGPPPAPATPTPGTFVRISEGTPLSWHPGHHRGMALQANRRWKYCKIHFLCELTSNFYVWSCINHHSLYEIVCAKMSHQSLARACDSSMSQ